MTRGGANPGVARAVGAAAGGALVLVGLVVLAGWYTGSDALVRLGTQVRPMTPNTAFAFAFCGFGLVAAAGGQRIPAALAAMVAGAMAVITLHGAAWGLETDIHYLLVDRVTTIGGLPPRPMAAHTAQAFIALSLGIAVLRVGRMGPVIAAATGSAMMGFVAAETLAYHLHLAAAPALRLTIGSSHTVVIFAVAAVALLTLSWCYGKESPALLPAVVATGPAAFSALLWQAVDVVSQPSMALGTIGDEVVLVLGTALAVVLAWTARIAQLSRRQRDVLRRLEFRVERETAERQHTQAHYAGLHRLLERTSDRLSALIDGTRDLIAAVDSDLRFMVMNRAFAESFHQAFAVWPMIGQRLPDLLADHPAGLGPLLPAWRRSAAGEAITATIALPGAGGRSAIYEANFTPLRDENGAVAGASMIARDVSERERAEERVRSERDLSQAIIDSLPGAFALLGESRHFLRWNRNLEQVARVSAAQVAAVDALSFFDGPDRETFAALLDDALTKGRSEAEAAMSVRGGARLPYLFSARRIDVDGQACILYSGIDVSALKRAEAALADKTRALEASNAELEQFAYVASHDLREPLRMVSAYVGLLERRYADRLDADAREFIAFARDGATRMDRLILDLLEYSRVGRKGAPLVRFESVEAVEAALANLGMAIDAAGAEIRLPEHLPAVVGDRGEIVRLFQNLIGNAIKYRHPERPPVVRLAVAPAAGGRWRFTVADNGIGIPEGDRERVFMIFQRLHARTEIEGSGIGLAICRKIVDRHGGRIWVEASPEGGSAFVFTLPGEG